MGTKRTELQLAKEGKGCLGKAAMNEPLFIIRAQDALACGTLEHWIKVGERHGVPEPKLQEARLCLLSIRTWQAKHEIKIPD